MLPTPDTSHVPYSRVYEPAEDSFLLLDTLSSPSETTFLTSHFAPAATDPHPPAPLILEVGPGSGVVLAFLTAHALALFGSRALLTLGIDANRFACAATATTARKACAEHAATAALFLDAVQGDLATAVRGGAVDVLVFNPPYVPTEELPALLSPAAAAAAAAVMVGEGGWDEDSRLLALSYAGGRDGMETTDRLVAALPGVLSARGVAYILLCAQNKPEDVKERVRGFGASWKAETVGGSGKQAGWERLQIVRVWRARATEL
ncbi:methyltransferase domain-containing protein [Lasiosphaeria hispida]|uniref:Methyltransferase domain-containing protein n=1 Tax=Lasiosphaeria hispida TaxID=260671 RepID=A0AAJ0HUP4_9PEZI|nr:methyltransferase domain-containing protein [Lasiosphaeria hispida]